MGIDVVPARVGELSAGYAVGVMPTVRRSCGIGGVSLYKKAAIHWRAGADGNGVVRIAVDPVGLPDDGAGSVANAHVVPVLRIRSLNDHIPGQNGTAIGRRDVMQVHWNIG